MPPQRELKIRMHGEDVAQLQNVMRQLNFPIEDSEGTFGRSTQEAVVRFQREIGLEPTGIVDEATAERIREALNRRNPERELEQLMNDLRETLEAIERLDSQDADVRAKIDAYASALQDHARRLEDLRRQGAPNRLVSRIEQMLQAGMAKLSEKEKEIGHGSITHVVRGRVFSDESEPLPDQIVVAVDKNVGGEVRITQSTSDTDGKYEIRFSREGIRKIKPDIQVHVIDENENLLASSEVRYNAGPVVTGLDVQIPEEKLVRPAEYNRLVDELAAHLGKPGERELKQKLAALKEDNKQQDITFLANKSGWDARAVAMSALANQYSEQTGIEPEFYYALFRAGVPGNEKALKSLSADAVKQVWEQAVEQRILPETLRHKIPENLDRFKNQSLRALLDGPPQVGVSKFTEMVGIIIRDREKQKQIAALYQEHSEKPDHFWDAVKNVLPEKEVELLQLNGKLGFLTINNAPLINRIHEKIREQHANRELQQPLDLVRQALYKQQNWENLLEGIPIPDEIPGEGQDKQKNYAALMSNHVRLSYPTAVVADMIARDEIPVGEDVEVKDKEEVSKFLYDHQDEFDIGIHSIEQFLHKKGIQLNPKHLEPIKKVQRVHQISPSDEAMGKLIRRGLDSAWAIAQFEEKEFIKEFKDDLGGEELARLTYAKSQQIHNTTFNIATSFLLDRSSLSLFATDKFFGKNGGNGGFEDGPSTTNDYSPAGTLEKIFGEMDYCACEHCRSWLSPAAYLVDLLLLLDPKSYRGLSPLDHLLKRRPDIQHIQLTCENTNTVLPYIDLVNEILEHFVTNESLHEFRGHDIEEGVTTEDLLAAPQFVNEMAYKKLRDEEKNFPPPLPFHQPLEALRRYFDHFDIPLHRAMEDFRENDKLDLPDDERVHKYGWCDILMERLQISRQEYKIFTDSNLSIQSLYGLDTDAGEEQVISALSNAKKYARRLNLSYVELIQIIQTQFINPEGHLIPKLQKLGVGFTDILDQLKGDISKEDFKKKVPLKDINTRNFGLKKQHQSEKEKADQIFKWLRETKDKIENLIVLSGTHDGKEVCSFDSVDICHFDDSSLNSLEFRKLNRFIRLWRKLGWSIEQTDKAINSLFGTETETEPEGADKKLDSGFAKALTRLAHLVTIMDFLNLNPKLDLDQLLACWSPIEVHGNHCLYRRMFLNPTIVELDDVFEEDGFGNYLQDTNQIIIHHSEALRAAFNLTEEELQLILEELEFRDNAKLNLENVSAIFRYGFLARAMRLSVQKFLALKNISDLNPFQPLDIAQPLETEEPHGYVRPPAIRFIELDRQIKQSPFNISQLLYYLEHNDLSGKSSPPNQDILALARTLRNDLLRIDREHTIQDDPTGEIAKAKMALVYGNETTDFFFGLLNENTSFSADYTHDKESLGDNIQSVTKQLEYDHFQKKLSFKGVMSESEKIELETVGNNAFKDAVRKIYQEGQKFFAEYPEFQPLYRAYVFFAQPGIEPPAKYSQEEIDAFFSVHESLEAHKALYLEALYSEEGQRSVLLSTFLPILRDQLKQQQVRQTLAAQVGADIALMSEVLENPLVLHAAGQREIPAVADFLGLETQGLTASIYYRENLSADPDEPDILVEAINYQDGGQTLPHNTEDDGARVSGIWQGYLEVPDNGCYNFSIIADGIDSVTFELDQEVIITYESDNTERVELGNSKRVELKTGQLYEFKLTATKIKDQLVIKWQRKGMGWNPIPKEQFYPAKHIAHFRRQYLRLLKICAIVDSLSLTGPELAHFAIHPDYAIDEQSWLNFLPAEPFPNKQHSPKLLENVMAVYEYSLLKKSLRVQEEALLTLLQDHLATGEDDEPLLPRVTGWQEDDRTCIRDHFGLADNDFTSLKHFSRVKRALDLVTAMGTGAKTLLEITTNDPEPAHVHKLQAALRARYDQSAWLKVIQPINDELRKVQRNALVAYVLQVLGQKEETKDINTPDKLFEYFLIDVQMSTCMKTSRIKQAISSVQLFIQRCLLDLEDGVKPSAINADYWEWMKRYRVWEANRKVFLFPENWLEPELRDNKSPFFKDLESELLQGDITDDAAATALVHYLEKLDEVAKLEICGMFSEEGGPGTSDDVVHVIARTAGARRTYYYRRQDGGKTWSPWEKIDLNIEDNPVLPVVWQGRLFLFWLSVMQEGGEPIPSELPRYPDNNVDVGGEEKSLTSLKLSDLKSAPGEATARVSVTLYWSEYYHRKWQPARASDIHKPLEIGVFKVKGKGFERNKLAIKSETGQQGELYVQVIYPQICSKYYMLYNTHSVPYWIYHPSVVFDGPLASYTAPDLPIYKQNIASTRRTALVKGSEVFVTHTDPVFHEGLIKSDSTAAIIEGKHYSISDNFLHPFFYQDKHHVFFVSIEKEFIPFGKHPDLYLTAAQQFIIESPPLIHQQQDKATLTSYYFRQESLIQEKFMPPIRYCIDKLYDFRFGKKIIGTRGSIVKKNQ